MYDLRRLRGTLIALAGVAAALGGFGLVASSALGGRPRWLPASDSTMDTIRYTTMGGKIAAVARPGALPRGERLGILLGSSSLQCAVDPTRLGPPPDGRPIRWLTLLGEGANGADLRDLGRHLARGGLRPAVLVLAINPSLLARSTEFLSDPSSFDLHILREHLTTRHLGLAQRDVEAMLLVPWNRAFPQRTRIGHQIRLLIQATKMRVAGAFGLGFASIYAPAADPWVVPDWTDRDHAPRSAIPMQMDGWRVRGWLDPASYALDGPNVLALMDLIRDARARGSEVIIVLMPEPSVLRDAMPAAARLTLDRALERHFGPASPRVFDLRDAMDDSEFWDTIHLDPHGKRVFTVRLSRAFRPPERSGAERLPAPGLPTP